MELKITTEATTRTWLAGEVIHLPKAETTYTFHVPEPTMEQIQAHTYGGWELITELGPATFYNQIHQRSVELYNVVSDEEVVARAGWRILQDMARIDGIPMHYTWSAMTGNTILITDDEPSLYDEVIETTNPENMIKKNLLGPDVFPVHVVE